MAEQGSKLGAYAPFLLMSAASIVPTVGFGIYDRVQQKKRQAEMERQQSQMSHNPNLAQWYAQNQGMR